MGFLFGGGAGTQPTKLSALSVQTMGYGVPIQICYGSNRVSPTLGYTTDFVAKKVKSPGGKGFGGSGGYHYEYSSTIELFVCEGEVLAFGTVWKDKAIYTDITKASFTFSKLGTAPQATWGTLDTKHPTESLNYANTVLIAASGYALSDGATLGNHSVEVFGRCLSAVSTDQNTKDAHIKDVITDFLTHANYGAISAQTANLTLEMTAMHDYCRAFGLLISPLLSTKKPAHEYLTEWALIANAGIVWSEGKLKFIPYADETLTGNGVTFAPDNTIRMAFDDDNISEPLKPTRKKPMDCFNQVTVECLNRRNAYNKHTVDAKDQADIEQFGLRPASALVLDSICLSGVAIKVANTQLLRGLYIRNTYTIKTGCDADLLEPMDFISLTDTDLGMAETRCRIIAIEDGQDGFLTLTAEESPAGVYNG